MTDTTHKAPERIWVEHRTCTVDASGAARLLAMDRPFSSATEYVRADLVQAAVERGFWAGRSCGGSKAEIDAALAAIREGGE